MGILLSGMLLLLLIPIIMVVGIVGVGRYLLEEKLKPNQKYLNEAKKLKINKISNFVNVIIIFLINIINIFTREFSIIILLPILIGINEFIRNRYMLSYIKTKSESESTRKYIMYDSYLQIISAILVLGLCIYVLVK